MKYNVTVEKDGENIEKQDSGETVWKKEWELDQRLHEKGIINEEECDMCQKGGGH